MGKKNQTILTGDQRVAIAKAVDRLLHQDHVLASDAGSLTVQAIIERAVLNSDHYDSIKVRSSTGGGILEVEYFTLGNTDGIRVEYRAKVYYLRLCADL